MDKEVGSRMFDFPAYYEEMARTLPHECRLLEAGVADGESAIYLAKELHRLGKDFTLYMVDNLDYGNLDQLCTIYENIIKSGLGERIKVIPKDSVSASALFNDGFLDFVFIDTSHQYEETKYSIRAWYPKVVDGGILAGHDFCSYTEVALAVTELIPETVTREPIGETIFPPETFLEIEGTDRGYGIWKCRKEWYKKLNP
jgi:cephalosporin hydroxylase